MTARPLRRAGGAARPAPPIRLLHLGLGNFFRAHQAWYTDLSPDAGEWGYAAFTGRSAELADVLTGQDGLYTLVTRAVEGDRYRIVGSLARAHPAGDHRSWLAYWRSADLAAVTVTVTEAGYLRDPGGGMGEASGALRSDLEALTSGAPAGVATAPGRLVAGLASRRAAGAGPVALVSCDNLPANGRIMREVVGDMADRVDPSLREWIDSSVSFVTTVVDRITPHPGADEPQRVARGTGWEDRCPVVTEPYSEWVISGAFPGGRPRWEDAGAVFTDHPGPYEQRKLWLLNGAHSLLAYAGSIRAHTTVPEAVADPVCREWVEDWWGVAAPHIPLPDPVLAAYRTDLLRRFANVRMADRLARIAEDGSQKLPVRILPVLREERAAGRLPLAATRVLAAWMCHLRGRGAPVRDARSDEVVPRARGPLVDAVRRVLLWLDPATGSDDEVVAAVAAQAEALA